MDRETRSAALRRLEPFVGEWRVGATFPSGPGAPAVSDDGVGRAVFEWTLDRQYLVQRTEAPRPAPDSLAIVGVDQDGETYSQHYFDSRGVTRVYAMAVNNGLWSLVRDSPDFSPLDFSQRFTGTFSADGETISGRWETSTDGASWEHDFALSYTRIT